jgi:antitoxin PrlF
MIRSKLTSKSQTTLPQAVRRALNVQPGDELVYEIEGSRVVLHKAPLDPFDDPFATFTEWASDLDKVYDDL